jgi:serine/threonine-protein kinase
MKFRIVLRPKLPRSLKRVMILALWVAGSAALMLAVFVFAFFAAMRVEMRSTQIEVPDLGGLTLEAARQRVEPLDLVLEVVDQRNDPRVASGCVLEQMPRAGASARRGRKMKLILSLGGKVLRVPELVGHASRAVTIELRQEGLIPGDETHVFSYDMSAGRVLAQVPPAETTVVPHSRVYRLVSDGPPPASWVMPDLRGHGRREAERWISLCGFRRGAVRRVSGGGRAPGTVLAQRPQAGYPIRSKDIVELVVAE